MSILSVAPILPTTDMARMQAHYEALGFTVKIHHGGYGTAARDGFNVHFGLRERVDEPGALYFGVSDVDALHAEWVAAGVGETGDVFDPGFGVREAAHTDPDGNIIRFGSKPAETPSP
jgi:predicted enzyme related to lactoylglutathione lyase